jgi:hypothetical protein
MGSSADCFGKRAGINILGNFFLRGNYMMFKKSTLIIWAVVLTLGIWGSIVYADTVVANIEFPFKVENRDFVAGKYTFDADLQTGTITLRSESTGKGVVLPIMTRLSARGDEASVVFDKEGDKYYLTEIYMPGIDGFEVKGGLTTKHTHVKVKAGK